MRYYTILWTQVCKIGVNAFIEKDGETTLAAYNEEDAEERFWTTHRKLMPLGNTGFDIRNILEGEEV